MRQGDEREPRAAQTGPAWPDAPIDLQPAHDALEVHLAQFRSIPLHPPPDPPPCPVPPRCPPCQHTQRDHGPDIDSRHHRPPTRAVSRCELVALGAPACGRTACPPKLRRSVGGRSAPSRWAALRGRGWLPCAEVARWRGRLTGWRPVPCAPGRPGS